VVFPHRDLAELEKLLSAKKGIGGRMWIVTERVFSMDGTLAPVDDVLDLASRFDAKVFFDEAHAAGLFPPLSKHPALAASVITGGKVLGCSGAFIASNQILIQWFINRARPFVFTTAPPPSVCAALTAAILIIQDSPELADYALKNAETLRELLGGAGIPADGESAIVPVLIGGDKKAMEVAGAVRASGFNVRAVRPPTVPDGTSRLRLVCHADHTPEQLEGLACAIANAL